MTLTRDELSELRSVVVPNDNKTFTGLTGCWLSPTSDEHVATLDDDEVVASEMPSDLRVEMQSLLEFAIRGGFFDGLIMQLNG